MNNRSGLSLFELLVALALLALIAAGLAGALGLGVRVWDRSATLNSHAEEIALRSRLRIWLGRATPPTRLTPFSAQFVGDENGFSFVTLSDTPFAPNAAALRVTVAVDGKTLRLTAQSIQDDGTPLSQIDGVLAQDITPRFAYYADTATPPAWLPTWEDTSRLPALVRIEAPAGSHPEWPEYVVQLQLR